jgi:hypothetical protein
MSALSDYLENALIDHILRGRSFTAPSTLYWALFTSAPGDTGSGTEVTGNNYSRVSMTPSDTAFTATQGGTSGASSGTGGTTSNGEVVQFPTPSGSWGTVIAVGIFDASSGGNLLIHGTLLGRTINTSDDVKFPVGAFSFQIDN